jgi:hypothetical protein
MKHTIKLLASALLLSVCGFSQNPGAGVSPQGPPAVPIFIEDIAGRPFSTKGLEDIEGSPYLLTDWSWGAVKFRNGKFAKDITLQYSPYNNKLYFKKGNDQQEFVQPVKEFILGYVEGADSVARIFRNGYPSTSNTKEETFFELLTDGKFQLLKHHVKTITSFKPYNQPERKKFAEVEDLFVLLPGNKMIKIKKDKNFLVNELPEYANKIESLVASNKLKLKTEEGIQQLFSLLNKESN